MELIRMYFDRGGSESLFDEMKNDYNVNHLPYNEAPYNLCYLCICALGMILVRAFKVLVHEKVGPYIKPKVRIKQLLFRVIVFPVRLVSTGRKKSYNLYCKQKELKPLFKWANS